MCGGHFAVAGSPLSGAAEETNASGQQMNYRPAEPSSLHRIMCGFCSTVSGAATNFPPLCSFRPPVRSK